jgi:protein-S-isoprenylcysteine O-methyltransferase Ste14
MMMQTQTQPPRVTWTARLALLYGALCYLMFLVTTVYAVGFVGDLLVPKSLDTGSVVSPLQALLIDVALLSLFALQHSVMARPAFKRWWVRAIPSQIERSTYVLFASLALLLLYWGWLPLPETIWNVSGAVVRFLVLALYGVGWLLVVLSSYLIDHAELFGLRQVSAFWKAADGDAPVFKTPALYRLVRHPMMVGFLIAFWAAPLMTVGHLLFCVVMTGYIVVGVHFEEHDLLADYGAAYQRYRGRVRMLVPFPKRRHAPAVHGQPTSKAS